MTMIRASRATNPSVSSRITATPAAIEIVYIDNEKRQSNASYDPITAFFKKHLG